MQSDASCFYINGKWTAPHGTTQTDIINPATELSIGKVSLGDSSDIQDAVAAAKAAFEGWSNLSLIERLDLLRAVTAELERRNDDIAEAITAEMGAPSGLSRRAQAPSGVQHFAEIVRILESYSFEEALGSTLLRREPIGVAALITPWNWPMNQIAAKVAPALAAGCTMVLKPSELAPLSATLFADILDKAGLPAGVFNLVHGDGMNAGAPLCAHPDIDMVSFTGSTRAGAAISAAAAPSIKRVALELGGKSAAIVLDDADLERAISSLVRACMTNSGQSCNAPSRILTPRPLYEKAALIARDTAAKLSLGAPESNPDMGPIANRAQYVRVIALIETGLAEKSELLCGGPGKPLGLETGFFVQPTLFGRVTPAMTLAREEVFGPVQVLMAYEDEDDAIRIANDSPYGLSGHVWSADPARALRLAARLRTGMVHLNGAPLDSAAPFGGYKMSGNGREWGKFGLEEFLEVKSVYGGAIKSA